MRYGFIGLLLLTLVACDDTTKNNGTTTPPTTLAAYTQQVLTKYCGLSAACGGETRLITWLTGSTTECVSIFTSLVQDDLESVQASIDAGKVVYDPNAAATCLQGLSAVHVCEGTGFAEVCAEAFQGQVAEGGACNRNIECQTGFYCDRGTFGEDCPGVCTAQLARGATCDRNAECQYAGADGFAECVYDDQTFESTCATYDIQAAPAAAGAPCGVIGADGDYDSVLCATGTYCKTDQGEKAGTCVAELAAGSTCTSRDVCAGQALCAGEGTTGICATVTIVETAGQPCSQAELKVCNPLKNLDCDETTNTCKTLGDGSQGSECSGADFFEAVSCNDGLYCDYDTHTCQARKAQGEQCTGDNECTSDNCSGGTCEAKTACD